MASRLSFDLTSIATEVFAFTPQSSRPLKLIWHFTPKQLQVIEDSRQGKEPYFELRSRLLAHVQYLTTDGRPNGEAHYTEESAYDFETHGYPVCFKIDYTAWGALSMRLDFATSFFRSFRFLPFRRRLDALSIMSRMLGIIIAPAGRMRP